MKTGHQRKTKPNPVLHERREDCQALQVRILLPTRIKNEIDMQTIYGKCPSKSNCYKVVTISGHGSLAKQEALKAYEKSFYLQCDKYRDKNIKELFELRLKVFYENQRPDLDNCLKIILDCLQQCRAIANDRNCVKITAEKFIDKVNPRIEFEITEI